MILKNLTLKNYRKFKNTTIEFPDGVTAVVGLNGAGKSTIFESIAWVLYGPVAARTSSELIKRQNAEKTEPCRVELEFQFEEDNYRIIREMRGKNLTANATVTLNGKIAATSTDAVNKYIQKKLGMDYKSFFTSIYAKQKELNTLSQMNAHERRPLILKMLGIDALDDVIKEIRTDKRNKDTLISKLSEEITDKQGKNKDEIYQKEIKDLENEKKLLQKNIKKQTEEIKEIQGKIKTDEKNEQKFKQKYEQLNVKKEELQDKKQKTEEKNKIKIEIKRLNEIIDKRKQKIKQEKKQMEKYENIETEIKSAEKRLEDISNHIEKIIKKIEQKKTINEKTLEDLNRIQKKRQNILDLGPTAKCPTCERQLSEQYTFLIEKFNNETNDKNESMKKIREEIQKNIDEKERVQRELAAVKKKKQYYQKQLNEKERTNATITHLENEIKKELNEIKNKEKQFDKLNQIRFDPKEFEKIKRELNENYKNYQESLNSLKENNCIRTNLKINIEKSFGEDKLIVQKIKNLNEKISDINKSKNNIKEEKKQVYYLKILSDLMNEFRLYLISRIRPTLSSYSTDFFTDLTDGKYAEVELDENYDLMILDQNEKYEIKRFSGGEEDLANLCLRLAISEVITERAGGAFNFIILDEIFGSQDINRRRNIITALNKLSGKFRQIFLISHIEDIKNDVENIINVEEESDGVSKIKLK